MSIRIGIMGYGNLGRGVECAIKHNPDMELVAVFTRRDPETLKILTETAGVYRAQDAEKMKDKIDVLILCGGSATDLPVQTPKYAQWFNVVDSFDTHARIPEHFDDVDRAAAESGHVGIISVGWDPGMFSLNRMYANAILTNGKDYTFWGKGVSQGHSDAIRRIEGVKDGKTVYDPCGGGSGGGAPGRGSRTDYKTETYKRMFCCCGRGSGSCPHRAGDQDNAQLFRRIRYHCSFYL